MPDVSSGYVRGPVMDSTDYIGTGGVGRIAARRRGLFSIPIGYEFKCRVETNKEFDDEVIAAMMLAIGELTNG